MKTPSAATDGGRKMHGVTTMTEYKHAYRAAFDFHAKHINAKTDSDWQDACDDMINEPDDFTRSLMLAVYAEIERKNALPKQ